MAFEKTRAEIDILLQRLVEMPEDASEVEQRLREKLNEMRAFGMRGFQGDRESILWFDLEPTNFYEEWKGRLIVDWPPPEISWWRWADRNRIPISLIHEHGILDTIA